MHGPPTPHPNTPPVCAGCALQALLVYRLRVRPACGLQDQPDWQEILTYFRGSELQNYFTRVLEDNLKVKRAHRALARPPASSQQP